MKKIIKIALSLVIMCSMFPVQAYAQNEETTTQSLVEKYEKNTEGNLNKENYDISNLSTKESYIPDQTLIYGDTSQITKGEWLHNLAVLFGLKLEDGYFPDNYYKDLTSDYSYYKDILLTMNEGIIDLEAGEYIGLNDPLTREFATQTLNDYLNYQLEETEYTYTDASEVSYPDDAQVAINRNWFVLIDGAFKPHQVVTSDEVRNIVNDVNSIMDSEKVDETISNVLVKEGVKIVSKETKVTIEEPTVTIFDNPVEIQQGEDFVVYSYGIPVAYTAESVSIENRITTIIVKEEKPEDVFEDAVIEGETDVDLSTFIPAEEFSTEFYSENGELVDPYFEDSVNLKTVNVFKDNLTIANGVKVDLHCVLSNLKLKYKVSKDENSYYLKLVGTSNLSANVKTSLSDLEGVSTSVTLGYVSFGGIGYASIVANLNLDGKVTLNYSGNFEMGFSSNNLTDFRIIGKMKDKTSSLISEVNANIGLSANAGFNLMNMVKAKVSLNTSLNSQMIMADYSDGELPQKCEQVSAYLGVNIASNATLGSGNLSKSFSKKIVIYDQSNSPIRLFVHLEDGIYKVPCTRGKEFKYYTGYDSSYWGGSYNMSSTGIGSNGEIFTLFEYTLDADNNATITKYHGNATVVNVPETLDGYTVVGIGNGVFAGRSEIVNILLPETLVSIDDGAFNKASSLMEITIPDGVTTIEEWSFANCTSLKKITLSKNLEIIRDYAFSNSNMTEVKIPDSVTTITSFAFSNCQNLASVTLSKNLETLGGYAFENCDSLTSILIPKSLKNTTDAYLGLRWDCGVFPNCDNLKNVEIEEGTTIVANGLFANCNGLNEVTIPNSITSINNNAFKNCINLEKAHLGNSITNIGDAAFKNSGLKEVAIPDSVTNISTFAFSNCQNLASVTLSKNLETLGGYAFENCDALTSIFIPKSLKNTTDAYLGLSWDCGVFPNCDNLKNVEFEEGTTIVANGLFANCNGLNEVTIPNSITSINNNAFKNCVNLEKAHLGNSITNIGDATFKNSGLKEVAIPDSVTNISTFAFSNCQNLASVTLSKNIETLGGYAFENCAALTSIFIPKSLKNTTDAYLGLRWDCGVFPNCQNLKTAEFEAGIENIPYGIFKNCIGLQEVIIPNSVLTIKKSAFENTSLNELILPDSVVIIGENAFRNSSKLSSITFSKNLHTIEARAFNNSDSLTAVVIPDSVTSMNVGIFEDCDQLKEAKIGKGLKYIQNYTFKNCDLLEKVIFEDNIREIGTEAFYNCINLKDIIIPSSVTSIYDSVFNNCDSLTTVIVPDSVISIGKNAFYDCDNLTNVQLGKGITSISNQIFGHCDSLESIVLPYRVTSIGQDAFKECLKLTSIFIPRATTTIHDSVFSYLDRVTIYGVLGTYAETYANEKGIKFVAKEANATEVILNKKEIIMNKGTTDKLTFTVTPEDFTDEVTMKSTDVNVATIDADGTIKAVGVGTATIKVTVGNVSATCKVTIVQPVTSISLNKSSLTLEALKAFQLEATINPSNAYNKKVEWSSSDANIASVDSTGIVTAHKKGTAIITVKALDGSNQTAQCTVTVTNNSYIITDENEFESSHNYSNNCSDYWIYTMNNAEYLDITFDERTNIEEDFDFLYIYDKDDKEVGKYTGTELAGKTIHVNGDTVKIKLVSDDSGNEWGFKVSKIETFKENVTDVFEDVHDYDWFKDSVQYVYDRGMMSGFGGRFSPEDNMTRSMIVSTLYRLEGSPEVTDKTAETIFSDVASGEWYTDAVNWAYSTGVTVGYPDRMMFGTYDNVTREQLAVFLYRYSETRGYDVSARKDLSEYRGYEQTSEYAIEAMQWATATGLITGSRVEENGEYVYYLLPGGNATRAQFASILMRFCEYYGL